MTAAGRRRHRRDARTKQAAACSTGSSPAPSAQRPATHSDHPSPAAMQLFRAAARARLPSLPAAAPALSSSHAAGFATGSDPSLADKARQKAGEAAGTNPEQPSIMEKMREGVGKVVEKVGEAFEETGKVGRQFTPEGKAGGTAQQVGGPFDKEGAVGKQFTTEGAVGGTVEAAAEAVDETGEKMQAKAQHRQGQEQQARRDSASTTAPASNAGSDPLSGPNVADPSTPIHSGGA